MNMNLAFMNLPNTQQRLDAVFQVFDGLMLVLDDAGRILDYKAGLSSPLEFTAKEKKTSKLQDILPLEVWRMYKRALEEIQNGSKMASFEYRLLVPRGEVFWRESRLVPVAGGKNIMFVRDITRSKQSSDHELALAYEKTVESWSQALYLRDKETEDHTRRVTANAVQLARRLGLGEEHLVHIRRGATLHDIGKVAIPDDILFKPGPLNNAEWEVMCRHPLIAYEILKPIQYLAPALCIPRWHHEKWDGSGYPDRLAREMIPLYARIFAFADVYDALTSDRPYRRAWATEKAARYIAEQSGKHFDPTLTPAFLAMVAET